MTLFIQTLSLEDMQSSVQVERELEVYVLMADPMELKNAISVEQQEQYSILPVTGQGHKGSTRIRKTTKNGVSEYIHTTKVRNEDGSNLEVENETTEQMFQAFKTLANDGLIKDRFIFPIEGTNLLWEVDVFPNKEGKYGPWAKLDLELPEGLDIAGQKLKLPISSKETVVKNRNDPKITKFIESLYEKFFRFNK